MSYIISSITNTFNLLEYCHNTSVDYTLFREGISLKGNCFQINYKAKNKASLNKIKKNHILFTTGIELVSSELREVLEKIAPTEVEFFDANIFFGNYVLHSYSAINVLTKINCFDMEKSEFTLTNFAPHNPQYAFLYTVLLDEIPYSFDIVRSEETPNTIVVSDKLKIAIINAGLKNIEFCKSIDLTPKNRSSCETS
ncbi:imm11 family protein [Providencia stuartii]|uniref:imm11 family protein n=1 Tax=Providencia stuartii TaxID=588 RepID=UPI0019CEF3F5|nr:DUF1629 domain-containing protein [Providencia thailandensis]GHB80780.1 hypothetical protein GCM10007290_00060 [Providencia thailandensis]